MKKYFKRMLPVLLAIAAVFTIIASPLTAAEKFSDVPDGEWYTEAIYDLADQGILNGKGDGIFAPMANITRGEFAKILAYASGDELTAYDNGSHFEVPIEFHLFAAAELDQSRNIKGFKKGYHGVGCRHPKRKGFGSGRCFRIDYNRFHCIYALSISAEALRSP